MWVLCRRCQELRPPDQFRWHRDVRIDGTVNGTPGGWLEQPCRECRRKRAPQAVPMSRFDAVVASFEARLDGFSARLDAMEEEIRALECTRNEQKTVEILVEWRPDHRRIIDGGTPVRRQKREISRRKAG